MVVDGEASETKVRRLGGFRYWLVTLPIVLGATTLIIYALFQRF
jgi:hypothetical protein